MHASPGMNALGALRGSLRLSRSRLDGSSLLSVFHYAYDMQVVMSYTKGRKISMALGRLSSTYLR